MFPTLFPVEYVIEIILIAIVTVFLIGLVVYREKENRRRAKKWKDTQDIFRELDRRIDRKDKNYENRF